MKENSIKNKAAVALGRLGGLAISRDREYMRKISKKANKVRWPKDRKIKNK